MSVTELCASWTHCDASTLHRGPLREHYRVGMPQLGRHGLSEHWLLKECGDRHWLSLAAGLDLPLPEFRDAAGRKLYAAFTLVRETGARLDAVAEHDRLRIESRSCPVGRSQHYGVHALTGIDGARLAKVEMLSAFVRRDRPGENRSMVRASLGSEGEARGPWRSDAALHDDAERFAAAAHAWRKNRWLPRYGFEPEARRALALLEHLPCPSSDFNGADLLYFASFQALVDRAEWAWLGAGDLDTLVEREIAFFGNVDVGEAITVQLCGLRESADERVHWCELRRSADGQRLAEVITRKRRARLRSRD
jgi:probable biosynthetic protein (TIGR04099 family)